MIRCRTLLFCLLVAYSCRAQQGGAVVRMTASERKDCVHAAMHAANESVETADHAYTSSDTSSAKAALDAALSDVRRGVDCALEGSRGQKNAEIELRRLSRRLSAVEQSIDADDRPYVHQAQVEVEKQRDRLLRAMFGAAAEVPPSEKKP